MMRLYTRHSEVINVTLRIMEKQEHNLIRMEVKTGRRDSGGDME